MKKVILSIAVLAMFSVTGCKTEVKKENESVKTEEKMEMATSDVYQCPMDCEKGKTYEKEGTCPVCKMDLKKVASQAKETEDHSGHNH
ncbi:MULTISPECIES: heavy metal-binding domain-containing protein [Flavobacteriaceae]|uniref:Heavy metal binding domain-containing protein n=2 Tax=Flavobacteriaceae TaxID=49546 RepID=A0A4Y8AV27_9FLAO|nr:MULTISPECIES: heavy metal-binding domain-containing protein [Flavobacteriaceae]TEW75222.1 hypothetical protein E2488_06810 [Gramella jeungdoensis]GGK40523.1 hypothetical protein GCM10007963_05710 [Lutibacter litoralis]